MRRAVVVCDGADKIMERNKGKIFFFLTFYYLQHHYEYLFLKKNCFLLQRTVTVIWSSSYVTKEVDKRMFYLLPFVFEMFFNRRFFRNTNQQSAVVVRGQRQLATIVLGMQMVSLSQAVPFLFNLQLYKDLLRFSSKTVRPGILLTPKENYSVADVQLLKLSGLLIPLLLVDDDLLHGLNFNCLRISIYDRSPLWRSTFWYLNKTLSPFLFKREAL